MIRSIFRRNAGRLKANSSLLVEGTNNVWALGDCALIPTPDGGFCPPTAQFATRQGKTAAHNIVAAIHGREQKAFQFKELGKLCRSGHRSAVAQVFGFNISGFLAWFMWRTIYLMKLPGWGRRLKVAASWTFELFLPPDLVQLKLTNATGVSHEHFEPGEEVFHQGDLGDRIYIIARGQAEVVRRENANEFLLARLGPGEYFGEMALLNQTTRNATVRCLQPLDVLSIHKREFAVLAANLPAMRESFELVMKQRRIATDNKIALSA